MTEVEFHYNASDRLKLAAGLAAEFVREGRRVLIIVDDKPAQDGLDRALWTFARLSFLPHCSVGADVAPETPVWLSTDPTCDADVDDVLINLAEAVPSCFSRFTTAVEIVGCDEVDKAPGRVRYKFYQDRGYRLTRFDYQQ